MHLIIQYILQEKLPPTSRFAVLRPKDHRNPKFTSSDTRTKHSNPPMVDTNRDPLLQLHQSATQLRNTELLFKHKIYETILQSILSPPLIHLALSTFSFPLFRFISFQPYSCPLSWIVLLHKIWVQKYFLHIFQPPSTLFIYLLLVPASDCSIALFGLFSSELKSKLQFNLWYGLVVLILTFLVPAFLSWLLILLASS